MKKKLYDMLQGIFGKEKPTKYTAEDMTKIEAECQKIFGKSFLDVMAEVQNETSQASAISPEHQSILDALFEGQADGSDENGGGAPQGADAGGENGDPLLRINQMKNEIAQLKAENKLLGEEGERTTPTRMKISVIPVTGGAHTDKYLFGIEHPSMELSHPWNKVAAERKPLSVIASTVGLAGDWDEYEGNFKAEVNKQGKSLMNRMAQLQAEGKLATIKAQDIDFSGFTGTGWGDQYIVRRQDALIAYIRQNNSLLGIFTVRYGVQNKEVLTNSFLSNFSQSFQSGRVFKGGVSVEPLEAQVFDVMFKHKFSNLKDLEKEYIGYLNQESSDPMKWTWIEWVLARILEVLQNEWNERRILGTRVEPTVGVAGHYLHGSDGVIRKLLRYAYEEFRIQPVSSIGNYVKSTMLVTVKSFVEHINEKVPSLKGYVCYYNEKHTPWYLEAFRTAYGLNQDFTGAKLTVMDYPDIEMIAVPNMGNSCLLILTPKGNIELYENAAGEMAKIGTQRDMEELMVYSYWKEGVGAFYVGRKHANETDLAADNYQSQYVFITNPIISLAADATTCDATKGMWFKSGVNTAVKTITDITGAQAGVVYRIILGDTTNVSKIAKSGKFDQVNAWTPTAVGDYIDVYLYFNRDDSTDAKNNKFIEVGRKVTV